MRSKDRVEMERAKLLKAIRKFVRLRHELAADEELNRVLPQAEAMFNRAVESGQPFELDVKSVIEELG